MIEVVFMVLFSLIVIFESWVYDGIVCSGRCKLNGQNNAFIGLSTESTLRFEGIAGNDRRKRRAIIIVIKNRNIYWLSVNFMVDTSITCY